MTSAASSVESRVSRGAAFWTRWSVCSKVTTAVPDGVVEGHLGEERGDVALFHELGTVVVVFLELVGGVLWARERERGGESAGEQDGLHVGETASRWVSFGDATQGIVSPRTESVPARGV